MKATLAIGAIMVLAVPATAQQMDHSNMPGMKMPAPQKPAARKPAVKPATKPPARRTANPSARPRSGAATRTPAAVPRKPAAKSPSPAADPHAGHDMATMPGMATPSGDAGQAAQSATPMPEGHDMSAMPGMAMPSPSGGAQTMDHSTMPGMAPGATMAETRPGHTATGTALAPGNAPAPAAPTDSYADRIYSPAAMAAAREDLRSEHGGNKVSMVLFNLAEYQFRNGRDGYRWDGNAWYGGDINRLVVKTEGEGSFGDRLEGAEVQALFSRAIGPFTDVQAGVRYDITPNPSRVYATIGLESLAPGFFDVEGALFLSNKGDLLGRLEGYYDQRITQRLILQPRAEVNFAAQDVRELGIGSGISNVELGLRLRYEVRREFAPYVGVSYDRQLGDSARFSRAEGEDVGGPSFVVGVRAWF